jgi:L-seryl-tRNA(Ser) seleniumtransferase
MDQTNQIDLKSLPSVDQVLQTRLAAELVAQYGRPLVIEAIGYVLEEINGNYNHEQTIPLRQSLIQTVQYRLESWFSSGIKPVINATGIIIHTNLGRTPLPRTALKEISNLNSFYLSFGYDLEKGEMGSRLKFVEILLKKITGAESAIVVNNNSAGLFLVLTALARRRRVIVSRTQLIEIQDGFRIPDILKQAGTISVEIGTTNQVHLSDYEDALCEPAAIILQVHHSNFKMTGSVLEPILEEVAEIAHQYGAILVHDLGLGALVDTRKYGISHEPTVQESLAAGVDIVCVSADKLIGGPQAGIIIGRSDLINKLSKHPLMRALQLDKLGLTALTSTLMHYVKDDIERSIPVYQMLAITPEQVRVRATYWAEELKIGRVIPGYSSIGGEYLTDAKLPTYLLALKVAQPFQFLKQLQKINAPILGRVENDLVVFDPRTVFPEQDGSFLVGLSNTLHEFSISKDKKNP